MQEAHARLSRLTRMGRALGALLKDARSPREAKASAVAPLIALDGNRQPVWAPQIGRASCRERV